MNPLEIINEYYEEGTPLYDILVAHGSVVAQKALEIAEKHPEMNLDKDFIYEAAMLHDIGIFATNSPKIYCFGELPYICHGSVGSEILMKKGYKKHALVCERHTGTGIGLREIIKNNYPIPHRDMIPETLEEKLICFADKFYSKSKPNKEKSIDKIRVKLAKHGNEKVERFDEWCKLFIVLLLSFFSYKTTAQEVITAPDTLQQKKTNAIDAPVYYQSKDSIVMIGTNLIYLFGEGNVKYQDLELDAEYIEIDTDNNLIYATFVKDSIGNDIGYPVFKQGSSQYESKTMNYNFKTKKGFIRDVITQQGDGFIISSHTKRMENDDLFMVDGKYTTCDNHDHPHFYLKMTRAKVRPGKDIVTGPAYLVVEDVPLPVAIPFGYFPFKSNYSSGIIFPSYGDELARGFCLREGGYYFAFNDYIDLALTGEVFTKGSWGANARSTYRKRYKYSGNFNLGYLVTILGDKGEPDYSKSNDFKIQWNHAQDTKANPFRTISANVDFTSSTHDRNQINSIYSNNLSTNQKSSSINLSQRFPDSPFSLNANMTINQMTKDSTVSMTLPSLSISMRQINPFKRKNPVGSQRWYEAITISYQGKLDNNFSGKENKLFKSNLIKDWRNGMTHNIPVSATFNVLNYINITPSINYSERWYTTKISQDYDPEKKRLMPSDTTYGFYRSYNFSGNINANTRLYGFYHPWRKLFGDKVQMIRHVFTPTIGFSGSPDFTDPKFGSFVNKTYIDQDGIEHNTQYSPYHYNLNPPLASKQSATLTFGFNNNLEMKIKSDRDSTGVRKISLIDQLSFNSGYNFLLDEFNWSNIQSSLRLKLSKSYSLSLSGVFDVYTYELAPDGKSGKRVNVTRWEAGKGIGRFTGTNTSLSHTFDNNTLSKLKNLFGKKEDSSKKGGSNNNDDDQEQTNVVPDAMSDTSNKTSLRSGKRDSSDGFDSDGYSIASIPWSLSMTYSIGFGYDYASFNPEKLEYNYKLNQTLGVSGNIQPTKGWRFNFSTSYDFDSRKFATMNCTVSRDLHCWSMSATFIPIGPFQSYYFSIAVNSSMLSDLKYNQSGNYRDSRKWE